jgi:hypothetical protein
VTWRKSGWQPRHRGVAKAAKTRLFGGGSWRRRGGGQQKMAKKAARQRPACMAHRGVAAAGGAGGVGVGSSLSDINAASGIMAASSA